MFTQANSTHYLPPKDFHQGGQVGELISPAIDPPSANLLSAPLSLLIASFPGGDNPTSILSFHLDALVNEKEAGGKQQ